MKLFVESRISQRSKNRHDFCVGTGYNRNYILFIYFWEGPNLKKLNAAVDRFAYSHPNFGIPNLMKVIVGGNIIVYLLAMFSGWGSVAFLSFNLHSVLHGEIWRLITFLFVPSNGSLFWLAVSLYFYYFIGSTLEREWGTAKFNLYYLSGVVLTLVSTIVASLLSGHNLTVSGTGYINMSMFFAFAMLYPDTQVLLFFIIPLKIKWLAWVDGGFFALSILSALFQGNLVGWVAPVIALLNFVVFFWTAICDEIDYRRGRVRHQTSAQTINFKKAAKEQRKKQTEQGYRHKCEVCGRTDADYPDLEFRYCSKCAGYHCFCEDHIFNHEHFTE